MKIVAVGIALASAVTCSSFSFAADMAVKAAPPAHNPAYNWTGFYIGVHGGGDWFDKDWFIPLTPINTAGGGCFGCPASAGGHTSSSWLFGGQVGFNYQVGWWVWGVEAQASW